MFLLRSLQPFIICKVKLYFKFCHFDRSRVSFLDVAEWTHDTKPFLSSTAQEHLLQPPEPGAVNPHLSRSRNFRLHSSKAAEGTKMFAKLKKKIAEEAATAPRTGVRIPRTISKESITSVGADSGDDFVSTLTSDI